jgi:hypothetical protein
MSNDRSIRDRIAQNDVTVARSYLEVDFMEWFSDNEIPFGYEAFTIPSVVGPRQEEWNTMIQAVRAIGNQDYDEYDRLVEGTSFEDMRAAEVQGIWQDIYDKHRLQEEQVTVEVTRSLAEYDKKLLLPDFALYPDAGIETAYDGFDWSSWSYILEVSGLWGVGLPDESTESDWWSWYRVAAVAYKELAYKLLGLWDDVYWLVPNQPFIEGVSDGIPRSLRDDDHYIIFNTTQAQPELSELYDSLGLSQRDVDEYQNRLSEPIELETYDRDIGESEITTRRFSFRGINYENVERDQDTIVLGDGWLVHHGYMGEVYFNTTGAHVRESMWRNRNMLLVREYVADIASKLAEKGIITGITEE